MDQDTYGVKEDEISIQIKTLQGDYDDYNVKPTDTIQSLINRYSKDKNFGANAKVSLSFKGTNLEGKQTFKDYEIENTDVIHALIRLQGGF